MGSPHTYWRQDDRDHHTLISNGHPVVTANHDTHSLSFTASRDDREIAIPRSIPLLHAAEQRLAIPVSPIRALPDARTDARIEDNRLAEAYRKANPRHKEAQRALERARDHLDARAEKEPLSSDADKAHTFIRMTLRELDKTNGLWNEQAQAHFKEVGYALSYLPRDAAPEERHARIEIERAQRTIQHKRTTRDLPEGAIEELEKFEQQERERNRNR